MKEGENKIRFSVWDDTNGEWADEKDCFFAIMGDGTKLLITKHHEEPRMCITGPWAEEMFTITQFRPDGRYHIRTEPTEEGAECVRHG